MSKFEEIWIDPRFQGVARILGAMEIPVDRIQADPNQPREGVDPKAQTVAHMFFHFGGHVRVGANGARHFPYRNFNLSGFNAGLGPP